jgi:hypothetical protein
MLVPQAAAGQTRWRGGKIQRCPTVALFRDLPGHGDRRRWLVHLQLVVSGRPVQVGLQLPLYESTTTPSPPSRHRLAKCNPLHNAKELCYERTSPACELQAAEGQADATSGGGAQ